MKNLLITGATGFNTVQLNSFKNLGFNITFFQQEAEELNFDPSTISSVICNNLFLYHDINEFSKLEVIQLTSAGTDRFPIEKIKDTKIKIFNAAGVYSIPIAEWIIAKILEFYKSSFYFYRNQIKKNWQKNRQIIELSGQKACIVGFGNIGQECARRLKAFDVEILAVENRKFNSKELFADKVYNSNELNKIIGEVDIVILTLPLNKSTYHMFNLNLIQRMKSSAILINTSRGGVIDEDALIKSLKERKIRGAALDVFINEPLKNESSFWKLDNVIITPHNSFVSNKNTERLFKLCKKNLSN
jgi:phosphoglycerate dehydrogenase-like enzyme